MISYASLVQVTLVFSTSTLVNKLLGSRTPVGHSSSLLSQRKSHRNCFRFSLFLSTFPTVFFITPSSVSSNYKQSFSRLPVQFCRISISLFQDSAILFSNYYVSIFHLTCASFFPYNCFQFFYINHVNCKTNKGLLLLLLPLYIEPSWSNFKHSTILRASKKIRN